MLFYALRMFIIFCGRLDFLPKIIDCGFPTIETTPNGQPFSFAVSSENLRAKMVKNSAEYGHNIQKEGDHISTSFPLSELSLRPIHFWLVVEPTHLKNMSQIGNLPPGRDENKKMFETTT